MEPGEHWRMLFENWPEVIPRSGLILTSFQETIPFTGFMLSGGLLLLERDRPDSQGARHVILGYDAIVAIKMTEVMDLARYQVMGFQPPI